MALQITPDGDDGEPSRVPLDSLGGRKRSFAKNVNKEMLGIGVSFLYEVPTMMLPPGTANHWPLTDAEEKTLVERIDAVADMLPKRTKSKAMEAIAKIVPPLALLGTVLLMTKPRIDMTRDAMARLRKQPPNPFPHAQSDPPSEQSANGRVVGTIDPTPASHVAATGEHAGSDVIPDTGDFDGVRSARTISLDNPAFSDATARF